MSENPPDRVVNSDAARPKLVVAPTHADVTALVRAIRLNLCYERTVGALAAAVEQVHWELGCERGPEFARRALVAADPTGAMETLLIDVVVRLGRKINAPDAPDAPPESAEHRTARAKPNRLRAWVETRDAAAYVLRDWVIGPDRYVDVVAGLASAVAAFADEYFVRPLGWREIADRWMQPHSFDRRRFRACYLVFYHRSRYFDRRLLLA